MNGTFESADLAAGAVVTQVADVNSERRTVVTTLPANKRLDLTRLFLNCFGRFMVPSLKQLDQFENQKRAAFHAGSSSAPVSPYAAGPAAPIDSSQELTREVKHV